MGLFDLFKRKTAEEGVYSLEKHLEARYKEAPFDRFIDAYVLWVIGELPPGYDQHLQQLLPMLRQIQQRDPYISEESRAAGDTWQQVIEAMFFKPETRAAIIGLWEKSKKKQAEHNAPPLPMEFAIMFVDANFKD